MVVLHDVTMQAVVEDIDWSAVDDLSCGIELEVSGDAQRPQLHTDGKLLLLLQFHVTEIFQ